MTEAQPAPQEPSQAAIEVKLHDAARVAEQQADQITPPPAEPGTPAEGVTQGAEPSEPNQPDVVTQLAMKLGFNPDYQGKGAVDAETFILRSRTIQDNLTGTVRDLRKELDAVREGVEAVRWSSEQARKAEVGRLKSEITALKAERRQAIQEGEADRVEALDGQIDVRKEQMREEQPAKPPAQSTQHANPVFDQWAVKNTWYGTDDTMTQFANDYANRIEAAEGTQPYPSLLKRVQAAVTAEFPEHFSGLNSPVTPQAQQTTPNVASGTPPQKQAAAVAKSAAVSPSRQRPSPTKPKATAADLSPEQRDIGKDCVMHGLYGSLDEYAQTLQSMVEKEKK